MSKNPSNIEKLINLTCPKSGFKFDENSMLTLCMENFEIIRKEFESDELIYSEVKEIVEKDNYSKEDYKEIIRVIAAKNHTRTPANVCDELAGLAVKSNLLDGIKQGRTEIVDELINGLKTRKERSLTSKVCRYLETWKAENKKFTINDTILRAVLPYYMKQYCPTNCHIPSDVSFKEYLGYCQDLLANCDIENLHELDYLLWYFYSKDSIRFEIIKHL